MKNIDTWELYYLLQETRMQLAGMQTFARHLYPEEFQEKIAKADIMLHNTYMLAKIDKKLEELKPEF